MSSSRPYSSCAAACRPRGFELSYGCHQKFGHSGERDPKLFLHMAARYFPRARICVTPPDGAERTCKTYKVKDLGPIFGIRIRWSAKFPNHGPGRYKVKWYAAGSSSEGLGPSVSFRR